MLMPTGYRNGLDPLIDEPANESMAIISTWDSRKIMNYEVMGRADVEEYRNAMEIMNAFIGRKGVFLPRLIITDKKGNVLETTNRTDITAAENLRKTQLLGYHAGKSGLPLTNPFSKKDELEALFRKSAFSGND